MLNRLQLWFDRFLFESCSVATCVLLRIAYSVLLIIYTLIWLRDGPTWFSDAGLMSADSARVIQTGWQWSVFLWFPTSPALIQVCLSVLLANAVLMLVGVYSRLQAAMVFFWLINLQHRNPLVMDGEDTVFRMLAFFLIWLPMDDCLSLRRWFWTGVTTMSCGISSRAWGVRLIQLEMSLIYFSAAWSKWLGESWRDGSALFYVYQMGDLFGRFPLPATVLETEWVIRCSTWSVLVIEAALPVLLWFRRTRPLGLALAFGLHLLMEYAMHLFLFQWVMMVGLLSFVDPSRCQLRCWTSQNRKTVKED